MNALSFEESTGTAELVSVRPALLDPTAVMPVDFPARNRTAADEIENAATHGMGFMLATVGAYLMLERLATGTHGWLAVGCAMYLVSLLGVYSMSTMSHAATSLPRKFLYRQLDQGFIYLLIVATYTPFSIAFLHGPIWTLLLCAMWAVAIGGFVKKVFFAHHVNRVALLPPVLLGWMPIVSLPTLVQVAPAGAVNLILAGGACYTVGILFLAYDERVKHFHAVWHLSVIAGSTFHFLGIMNYVLTVY